jgi:predicted nucleotidyltransferase component of viral defense system
MLDEKFLQSLATKKQINELSIYREYCQHLFLSYFYSKKGAEKFLFKGGTALRIIFQSPRYSVDLDFSAGAIDKKEIEDLLQEVIQDFHNEGLTISEIPSSEPTSGGYISFLDFTSQLFNPRIQLNIQKKEASSLGSSSKLVNNDFIPPYSMVYLKDEILISEKIEAFLTRENAKERDFFDLYFILNSDYLRGLVKRDDSLKTKIIDRLETIDDNQIKSGLRDLLPINHQSLLMNSNLKMQIKRLVETYL